MKQKQLIPFILLSLLVHLLMVLFVRFIKIPVFESGPKLAQAIWIDLKEKEYQLVDIQPPAQEERPEDSRFLGNYDSRVSEEMVEEGSQQGGGGGLSLEDSNLREEYPDVKRGPHTYLNVLRFPQVQYFIMMRKVFATTFNPEPSLREAYFQNRIAKGEIETVVGVSIDPQGNLVELFVLRGSGIEEYDQEVLRAFRDSAPFSKPPFKFLVDGLLRVGLGIVVYL